MKEVEKMYKNAGIAKIGNKKCTPAEFLDCQNYCFISENNKCDKFSFEYPPFTPEKQIALLQLLTQQCDLTISHFTEWEFIHYDGQEPTQVTGKDFIETFVKLINAYWQSLTEEERAQIKEILE